MIITALLVTNEMIDSPILSYFPYFHKVNWISGFDFNKTGEFMATISTEGICLVSDVSTDSYSFHRDLKDGGILI